MLSDKQINEIVSKNMDKFVSAAVTDDDYEVCCDVLSGVVKEALDLAEKSKWKYPEKGELPKDKEIVLVCFGERKHPDMAIHDKQCEGFIDTVNHLHFSYDEVKAWTYVPTMEGE